ncbi:minor tail protein [Rhodobacter phage RcMotherGoose]|nr:minor tail protein [Rhodobacter phage RcMotherGoose]
MGGSKKQTVGYKYFAGMHMVLCHGPIDKITRITVDEKELWAGSNTGGAITVDKGDLFGGDSREGGISGTLDFMTGHASQLPNDYLASVLGSLVPAFRGVVSIVLRQMYLSMNPYLKTWGFTVQRIHLQQDGSAQWQDSYAQIDVTVYDAEGLPVSLAAMNPAHIIRECLTNKLWGMGYNDGDINEAAFLAAAITLKNELMGMALLWDTQTSIEEFVKIILQHIDASLYVDRKTGQFVLKLIRGGYDEGDLIVLDPSNIDKIEDFKRPAFGELANSITVNYWDGSKDQTGSVTVQDIALAQEQGGENNTTVTYEGFIDPATASKAAQRDLKTLSTPLITCTIYTTKIARNLNIGDVFILSWPDYQIESVVMRITGIAYGDGKTRRVRIQCAQDVFSYPEDAFVTKPPSGWVDPIGPPGPVVFQKAFEMPYFELVRDNGQSVVDSSLASNPYVGYVGAACSAPATASINALMHSDDGSGYQEVGQTDFCAGAFLADDLGYLTTEFDLLSGSSLSLVDAGEWLQIDGELMSVVSLVGSTLTVKRGVLDTLPALHTAGAQVLFWDGFAATDPTEYVASDVVGVKLTAANGSGVYPLASATPMSVEVVGRAARPFPPGALRFNGEHYPATTFGGSIVVAWNDRNRIFQTGGTLVGFEDAALTPEAGATVTINFYNKFATLFHTESGITTSSFTITTTLLAGLDEKIFVELFAVRDGLESMQRYYVEIKISSGIDGGSLVFEMTDTTAPPAGDAINFEMGA